MDVTSITKTFAYIYNFQGSCGRVGGFSDDNKEIIVFLSASSYLYDNENQKWNSKDVPFIHWVVRENERFPNITDNFEDHRNHQERKDSLLFHQYLHQQPVFLRKSTLSYRSKSVLLDLRLLLDFGSFFAFGSFFTGDFPLLAFGLSSSKETMFVISSSSFSMTTTTERLPVQESFRNNPDSSNSLTVRNCSALFVRYVGPSFEISVASFIGKCWAWRGFARSISLRKLFSRKSSVLLIIRLPAIASWALS